MGRRWWGEDGVERRSGEEHTTAEKKTTPDVERSVEERIYGT